MSRTASASLMPRKARRFPVKADGVSTDLPPQFVKHFVKRLLRKVLSERRIRNLRALMRNPAIHNNPPVVCKPESGKILVLAPHMDDEVLGCGGTIARHAQAGADVTVIFLTDGRRGIGTIAALPEPERGRRERELVDTRKQEARRAGEILGV